MIKKHIEIKTYMYGGIGVTVCIDYEDQIISLIEKPSYQNDKSGFAHDSKKWVFARRDLDYMNGWLNILEAMKYAIESASEELRKYLAVEQKAKEQTVEKVLMKATDIIRDEEARVCRVDGCLNKCKSKGLSGGKQVFRNSCQKHRK